MKNKTIMTLHFIWLTLGMPCLGALLGGIAGFCGGFILRWLIDLPNHQFWFVGFGCMFAGALEGALIGWKTVFLIFKNLPPKG